jgi:hypothetical protein
VKDTLSFFDWRVAVNMGGRDARPLELLDEPEGLRHAGRKEQCRSSKGIQLSPPGNDICKYLGLIPREDFAELLIVVFPNLVPFDPL